MLHSPGRNNIPENVRTFVRDRLDALASCYREFNDLQHKAEITYGIETKLANAVANIVATMSQWTNSDYFEDPALVILAERVIADSFIRIVEDIEQQPTNNISLGFQVSFLQKLGSLSNHDTIVFDDSLLSKIDELPLIHIPEEALLYKKSDLQSVTGVPWRNINIGDGGSDQEGEAGWLAAFASEGAARALISSLRNVGYTNSEVSWKTLLHGAAKYGVFIRGDVWSTDEFESSVGNSIACREFREAVKLKRFYVDSYTVFKHQKSAEFDSNISRPEGIAYECVVMSRTKFDIDLHFAREIQHLLRFECLPPGSPECGYTLMFNNEQVRDAVLKLIMRIVDEFGISLDVNPWQTKLHRYDPRYEIHLPPKLVEKCKFKECIWANNELLELFREFSNLDSVIIQPLSLEIENQQARLIENRLKISEGQAEKQAVIYDTSLTSGLRKLILRDLIELRDEGKDKYELLSAREIYEELNGQSLVQLVEDDTKRVDFIRALASKALQNISSNLLSIRKDYSIESIVKQIDQEVSILMDRYMDNMDEHARYKRLD